MCRPHRTHGLATDGVNMPVLGVSVRHLRLFVDAPRGCTGRRVCWHQRRRGTAVTTIRPCFKDP
ncbi:hypothetical protein ACRAWF_36050, partial [Streptomyces sp. L7]